MTRLRHETGTPFQPTFTVRPAPLPYATRESASRGYYAPTRLPKSIVAGLILGVLAIICGLLGMVPGANVVILLAAPLAAMGWAWTVYGGLRYRRCLPKAAFVVGLVLNTIVVTLGAIPFYFVLHFGGFGF